MPIQTTMKAYEEQASLGDSEHPDPPKSGQVGFRTSALENNDLSQRTFDYQRFSFCSSQGFIALSSTQRRYTRSGQSLLKSSSVNNRGDSTELMGKRGPNLALCLARFLRMPPRTDRLTLQPLCCGFFSSLYHLSSCHSRFLLLGLSCFPSFEQRQALLPSAFTDSLPSSCWAPPQGHRSHLSPQRARPPYKPPLLLHRNHHCHRTRSPPCHQHRPRNRSDLYAGPPYQSSTAVELRPTSAHRLRSK